MSKNFFLLNSLLVVCFLVFSLLSGEFFTMIFSSSIFAYWFFYLIYILVNLVKMKFKGVCFKYKLLFIPFLTFLFHCAAVSLINDRLDYLDSVVKYNVLNGAYCSLSNGTKIQNKSFGVSRNYIVKVDKDCHGVITSSYSIPKFQYMYCGCASKAKTKQPA